MGSSSVPWAIVFVTVAAVVVVDAALKYEAPEDCTWTWKDTQAGKVSLTCKFRTINGDFERTNFSFSQSDHTIGLRLECSDVLFFESSLKSHGFQRLPLLEELEIEFCKIRTVPPRAFDGLRELKRFSLRTHNADWTAMAMELHSDTFVGLRELQKLDLAENNIWTLPPALFCELYNLQVLNLTRNHLQDLAELGFVLSDDVEERDSKRCFIDLKNLDLSHNDYVNLPPYGFSRLKRLHRLFLQHNEISSVADYAFSGLEALRLLNMSSNQLVALPPELFQSSRDLREIYVQNNSISVLAPGLLEGLDQLLVLDLSFNALTSTWVHRDTFKGLIRLIILNLAHNALAKLDANTFKDLYSLQILNLEHNNIDSVEDNTFLPLYNLHTLILAHNNLVRVDPLDFNGLYVLSRLELDHNAIVDVHELAFRNCSNLQDLSLSGNDLTHVPAAISDLQFLQTLDLGENAVTALPEGGLRGLPQLAGLRLVANRLTELGKGALGSLPSLRVLNLAHNGLRRLEPGSLDACCPELRALRLDSNTLEDVAGALSPLSHLLWLNLSANRLNSFDYGYLPTNLEWLDLSHNRIVQLADYFDRQNRLRLKSLDVSLNQLTRLTDESLPDSLEQLFANNNFITDVAPNTFLRKTNLSRVDLYANQMEKLELVALRLSPVPENRNLPEFYIGGNPFHCDCSMEWLQRINQMGLRQHPKVMDLENIMCRLTYNRGRSHVPLVETHPSNFLCGYETHCFALCHCCDFDACDCEMTCPSKCTCYHDQTWTANIVECANNGYDTIPSRIPMDVTELYLDGNDIRVLKSHVFIGRKNMKTLYINGSHVELIENKTFNGLNSLQVLHLEDNALRELGGSEFEQLTHLRELYLHNNRLSYVSNITFLQLKSLEILRLDGNNLVAYPAWHLSLNPYLIEVTLSNNRWSCDCQFMHELYIWVHETGRKVVDANELQCYNNRSRSYGVHLRDYNTTCGVYSNSVIRNMVMGDYWPVMATLLTVFLLSIVIIVMVFWYRKELRVCLYSYFGIRLFHKSPCEGGDDDAEKEKQYDAYIWYSLKDEELVCQELVSELHHDPSYRLCLHHRNSDKKPCVGDGEIRMADLSRRLVLVVSRNFLQTEWAANCCDFRRALQQRQAQQGDRRMRRKLVVLLLESLPDQDIDEEMHLYLKTATCITWRERRFWEKLRLALPDVGRAHYHRNISNFSIDGKTENNHPATHYQQHNPFWPYPPTAPPLAPSVAATSASPVHSILRKASHHHHHPPHETDGPYAQSLVNPYTQLEHNYMSIDCNTLRSAEHVYSTIDSSPTFKRAQQQQPHAAVAAAAAAAAAAASSGDRTRDDIPKKGTIVRNSPNGHCVQTYLV